MCTWLAREARKQDPRPVCILDRRGRPRWHSLWDGNPNLTSDPDGAQTLVDGPGVRHYIAGKSTRRWVWIEHPNREPGDLQLVPQPSHGRIYIEPNIKATAPVNKNWGFANYQAVVDALGRPFVQCGPGPRLERVEYVDTRTFEGALDVLDGASAYIGPEGGLHHAAAALGVPSVVIFGGYISPAVTGYRTQTNLYAGGQPCGMRESCPHCRAAMAAITPTQVCVALNTLLEGT